MELEGMLVVKPKECEHCRLWRQAASLGKNEEERKAIRSFKKLYLHLQRVR